MPEGPCPALPGSVGIHLAPPGFVIEEHTVSVGKLLQALSVAYPTDIPALEVLAVLTEARCQGKELILTYPDIAFFSSAAIAAPGALKV